jgi:hypothetical protein
MLIMNCFSGIFDKAFGHSEYGLGIATFYFHKVI